MKMYIVMIIVDHIFATAGYHDVTLTVTDNFGLTGSDKIYLNLMFLNKIISHSYYLFN